MMINIRLPLIGMLSCLLFCIPLSAQDCDTPTNLLDSSSALNDSTHLSAILQLPNAATRICLLEKQTQAHFNNYKYKKSILYGAALHEQYKKSSVEDSTKILNNWEILSNAYYEMGIPDSVLYFGKKLLWEWDKDIKYAPAQLPRILEIVAMSFADKLQYDLALEWIDMIGYHLLSEEMGETELYAGVLYVKGVVYARKLELEEADTILSEIIMNIELRESNTYLRSITFKIRLNLYFQDFNEAEKFLKIGENLFKETAVLDTSTYVSYLMNSTYFYLLTGDFEKIEAITQECLKITEEFDKVPALYSKVRLFAAMNYFESGAVEKGIRYVRNAITFLNKDIFYFNSNKDLRNTLYEAISTFLNAKYIDEGDLKDLKEAWSYRRKINKNYLKNRIEANSLTSTGEMPYQDVLDLRNSYEYYFKLMKAESNEELFVHGLLLSDQIKSDVLSYSVLKATLQEKRKHLNSLFERNERCKNRIKDVLSQIDTSLYGFGKLYSDFKSVLNERVKQGGLITQINSQIPALDTDFSFEDNYDLATLQNRLANDSCTVLNFFYNESDLYVSLISPFKFYVEKINVDSFGLDSIVSNYVGVLKSNPYGKYDNSGLKWEHDALRIYEILLKPFEKDIVGGLLIIPDGILNYLPFSSLLKKEPKNIGEFREYDFVVKSRNTFYSHSISNLFYHKKVDKDLEKLSFLGVAPGFANAVGVDNIRDGIGALRFNIDEVLEIEKIIGGEILIGKEPTLKNLQYEVKDVNIVHFATHSFLSPGENRLELVLKDEKDGNYNSVKVDEILLENTSPDLVVLSACNSAFGEVVLGEGMNSMTNNFFKRGASSVISTLWEASDYSMKQIFVSFYRNFSKGESVSKSLQIAQKEFINTSANEFLHPYYWSSVNSYGSGSLTFNSEENDAFLKYLLIGIVICFLIGIVGLKHNF